MGNVSPLRPSMWKRTNSRPWRVYAAVKIDTCRALLARCTWVVHHTNALKQVSYVLIALYVYATHHRSPVVVYELDTRLPGTVLYHRMALRRSIAG